jgi:uncharacterized protein YndB with AHSA1/START domain
MKVTNTPDFELTDAGCKEATGKTMAEWFEAFDAIDGLTTGRRAIGQFLLENKASAWWAATLVVEYERHHDVKKKDGLYEGYTICVTKNIAAPVDRVYSLWTNPAAFGQMYGDDVKLDVAEGASFSCAGGTKATFTRIRPDKDLRFSWEHPGCSSTMTVDVQFQDNKGKTLMNVMTSRIQTRGEADGLRNAWADFLNKLKAKAEA